MKLLVVEDDPITAKLLMNIISKQGYGVDCKTNGAAALKALRKQTYRIVLTDWMMPEMDGLDLCRRIRALKLPSNIYVILLTSKSSKTDTVAGLESGADDYIIKPFDKDELLARIRVGKRMMELEDSNRETHRKLTRSEKMAAVGHLAAGVAHEINNPIGFINSNLNSLHGYIHDIKAMFSSYRDLIKTLEYSIDQKKMCPDLPQMVKRSIALENQFDLDFIIEDFDELIRDCTLGAQRIKNIVHEMRYFTYPERQKFEPCRLEKILSNAVTQFKDQLPSGASIQNTVDHLPEIECNVPHIEKAFTNIIRNAVDAIETEGTIEIGGCSLNGTIEIKIADNGRGIQPEHLSMVFNPFFTTKEPGQGIGLGLTTALNIIKMHNGTINAESKRKMTLFTVRFPIKDALPDQE